MELTTEKIWELGEKEGLDSSSVIGEWIEFTLKKCNEENVKEKFANTNKVKCH